MRVIIILFPLKQFSKHNNSLILSDLMMYKFGIKTIHCSKPVDILSNLWSTFSC